MLNQSQALLIVWLAEVIVIKLMTILWSQYDFIIRLVICDLSQHKVWLDFMWEVLWWLMVEELYVSDLI